MVRRPGQQPAHRARLRGGAAAPPADRFSAAIAAIDAQNAEDPTQASDGAGEAPAALLYGRRMSGWLLRLAPAACEALRLAARAQHVARWKIPRRSYAEGRAGYLQWRRDLGRFHAETAAAILEKAGYGPDEVARVADLLEKKSLKRDPDAQTLEDAACLVFLEHQFTDFSRRHEDDKVVEILRKTLAKMSDRGRAEAAALVESLPADRRAVVARAMADPA
jgi:hypothetical protein